MSFAFALIFIAFVLGDVGWLIAVRRTMPTIGGWRFVRRASFAFLGVMLTALLVTLFGRFVGVRLDGAMPRPLLICVYVWHFIGLAIAMIAGLLVGVSNIGSRLLRGRSVSDAIAAESHQLAPNESPPVSRREILVRAAALAPVVATLASTAAAEIELNRFRIRSIDVPLRGLPSALDGMTIAHVSDVHLGRFTTEATFRRIVRATNDLDCDLVLQTGDLINYDQRDLPVAAELSHALRGKYGQFMCEGNHDLIEGRDAFEAAAKKLRLPILIDDVAGVNVNGVEVNLLGLSWLRAIRGQSVDSSYSSAVSRLAARRSSTGFPILLAHHPHAFDAPVANQLPLTLSGHTHGGQIQLSKNLGFGPLMYRYWSGLYEREGRSLVVSNGAGNWFPIRANAPAEILRLTLRRMP